MLCAERDSLRHEYRSAVQNLRESIRDLVILVDNSVADAVFNSSHQRVGVARRAYEEARDALEHHQAEHGC